MMMLATLAFAVAQATASPPDCTAATAFTGTICTPGTPGKHPAILLLGGSEGGDGMSHVAPTFAREGYVAASVAYFGAPSLPDTLQQVPVETVGTALADLERRDDVDPHRIGLFGVSKGGEFALLAGSRYADIRAVVADVPSPFAWEGIPRGASSPRESSWTVGGKPVAYVPYADAMGQAFGTAFATHAPLDMRPAYDASMKDDAAVTAAFFHLEDIAGPVLFLSGGDDRIWDSVAQARMGLAYLKKMHHPYADASLEYPLAGHLFAFATAERPFVDAPFAGGLTLLLGGTPQANVDAASDAWPKITAFLAGALR